MKNIGLIANLDKPGVNEVLPGLAQRAATHGLKLIADPQTVGETFGMDTRPCEEFSENVEAVLTLGGDGTLLSAVRRLGGTTTPLLGVNFGKLGFLTSLTQSQIDDGLAALAAGELQVSKRSLLRCTVIQEDGSEESCLAMNDIVLSWGASSHIAHLDVRLNEGKVTTYTCDGIILSSATGSTGHSLSAGGPILHPDTDNMVLTPICPHSMNVRPVVIPGSARFQIAPVANSKTLVLAADGQPLCELGPGAKLVAEQTQQQVHLLHPKEYDYWRVLETKLHWRGSHVQS